MNAALLMLTSAWAPADHTPPAPAPVVVSTGSACGGGYAPAAASCDSCGKPSLLDKLKGRFGSFSFKKSCGCETPAPACAPAPVACAPAPVCDPCASKPSFFDKLRGRMGGWGHKKSSCDTCGDAAPVYAAAPVVVPQAPCAGAVTTVPPTNPPVVVPPAKDMPKEAPKVAPPKVDTPKEMPKVVPAPAKTPEKIGGANGPSITPVSGHSPF